VQVAPLELEEDDELFELNEDAELLKLDEDDELDDDAVPPELLDDDVLEGGNVLEAFDDKDDNADELALDNDALVKEVSPEVLDRCDPLDLDDDRLDDAPPPPGDVVLALPVAPPPPPPPAPTGWSEIPRIESQPVRAKKVPTRRSTEREEIRITMLLSPEVRGAPTPPECSQRHAHLAP
jgi:hypothetical protein